MSVRFIPPKTASKLEMSRSIHLLNNWIYRYVTFSDNFLAILPIHRSSRLAILWAAGKITFIPLQLS